MQYVVVAVLLCSLVTFLAPSSSSAAGYTAELKLRGPADAQLLRTLDISVESVVKGVASVWITAAEGRALRRAGLTPKPVLEGAFLKVDKDGLAAGYHNPETCVADFTSWAAAHPDICTLTQIGTSVKGRPIVAMKITTDPANHGFKPLVRICGAHHGNEVGGSECVIMFTKYLLDNYQTDARLAKLVAEYELWIVPMVNPDGVAQRTRYNGNGTDLNRNYGYQWDGGYKADGAGKAGRGAFSEPESRAMRDHGADLPFSLSLSFHCSGDIVNYLWNYTGVRSPDQDLILELSEGYAKDNGYDVTEGWDWYQTNGDTNDWAYGCRGNLDWTIEVANPSFSGMNSVFAKNRDAMLSFIEQAGRGVCGTVTDAVTGQPLQAMVEPLPTGWPAFTHPVGGDFHRVLRPGTYQLRVWAPGYQPEMVEGVLVAAGAACRVDVALEPAPGVFHALNLMATERGDEKANTTHGPHALGPADGRFCSLGAGGLAVLDLSSVFPAGAAGKVTVHDAEGADAVAEAFELATSPSCDGPWTVVGTGAGTASIEGATLQRYVRVRGLGRGARDAGTITPGLDLDAVTVELKPATQARNFKAFFRR